MPGRLALTARNPRLAWDNGPDHIARRLRFRGWPASPLIFGQFVLGVCRTRAPFHPAPFQRPAEVGLDRQQDVQEVVMSCFPQYAFVRPILVPALERGVGTKLASRIHRFVRITVPRDRGGNRSAPCAYRAHPDGIADQGDLGAMGRGRSRKIPGDSDEKTPVCIRALLLTSRRARSAARPGGGPAPRQKSPVPRVINAPLAP